MDIKGESNDKDPQLKIEITAEKMDMISTVGIARAIKFYLGYEKNISNFKLKKGNNKVIVDKSSEISRPKIVAAIVRNVPMSQNFLDEIIAIQEKIHDSFGRNRKKAAIGIYPIDKISFPVHFKSEKPIEIKFQPLGSDISINGNEILEIHETGKKFKHLLEGYEFFPILKDSKGEVLSMPPIINSHNTGRVELSHKDLFVELTGFNLTHLDNILKVLITTFIEMGCSVESVKVEYPNKEIYELNLENTKDKINLNYVNKLIGIELKEKEVENLLNKMQYGFSKIENKEIEFEIPPYKSDVFNDCDVADDIARAYGYNNIIPKFPNISSIGNTLEFSDFRNQINQTLISLGFLELYSYMLTSTKYQFEMLNLEEKYFKFIKLPDSAEEGINMIRTLILPENLRSLVINRKNKYPQKIFENGFTIQEDLKTETLARDEVHLSCSIADPKSNYTQIKSILDSVLKLNEIQFEIKECIKPYLIEGRSAEILVKGKSVGFIGEIHPQVLENFSLIVPVSSFEINLIKIFELINN